MKRWRINEDVQNVYSNFEWTAKTTEEVVGPDHHPIPAGPRLLTGGLLSVQSALVWPQFRAGLDTD